MVKVFKNALQLFLDENDAEERRIFKSLRVRTASLVECLSYKLYINADKTPHKTVPTVDRTGAMQMMISQQLERD